MLAENFMSLDPVTIQADQKISDAARLMVDKKISVLPVLGADGSLQGIITQSDFVGKEIEIPHALVNIKHLLGTDFYSRDIEGIYHEAKSKKIADVMTTHVHTVGPKDSLDEVVRLMMKKKLKRIPVVVNKKLTGIITRRNLVTAFLDS